MNDRIPPLLELIKKNLFDPKKLTNHERRLCVQYLRVESNLTQARMAALLGTTRRTIERDCAYLNATAGLRFPREDIYAIFDMFYNEYMIQKERARAAKDRAGEMNLFFGFFDRLEKFGILKPVKTGDIVLGDKFVQNNNTLNVFQLAGSLDEQQKKQIRAALISAGLAQLEAKSA